MFDKREVFIIFQSCSKTIQPEASPVDHVSDGPDRETYYRTEKQVSGIVNPDVYPGVTGDDGPEHEKGGDGPVSEQ